VYRIFLISFLLISQAGTAQLTEKYIDQFASLAKEQMKKYGVPASITLAQGILESGNGNSELAKKANNHFGIKCHSTWEGERVYFDDDEKNECFRKYNNVRDSYEDHSLFLKKPRYEELFELKITDYKGWAEGLKKCGYATSPTYATQLIQLIEKYGLDKYDLETSGQQASLNYFISENRIKYVKALKGESVEELIKRTQIGKKRLAKYNDWPELMVLKEGEIVYLQPKRNRASVENYKVKKGDTLRSISQQYGIKMKRLLKLNDLTLESILKEGQVLILR
jgi:Mannosyl-glycoprotein endo-beta-N-acetylglucosaminidase/LysM domain